MKNRLRLLAIDLGAESGRAVLGEFDGTTIQQKEVDRFANEPVLFRETLYWDMLRIMLQVKKAVSAAAKLAGGRIESIGVSSWGVDFGLLANDGSLIQNPVHYRDKRTSGQAAKVMQKVPRNVILEETGYQIFEIATLFQLSYLVESGSWVLEVADKLLMIADLINYYLCGAKFCEYTLATTSGIYNPVAMCWSRKIAEPLGIPLRIFPDIVQPGSKVGTLPADFASELSTSKTAVVAPACHDTASAVAGAPLLAPDSGFISCGTWSVLGVEKRKPIFDSKAFDKGFLNEGGVAGSVIFAKNLTGLWILQSCRREWQHAAGREISWDEIVELAQKARPLTRFIDTDDHLFLRPQNMVKTIVDFCQMTGQPLPEDIGSISRCCIESLAMKYRETYLQLTDIIGSPLKRIHLIGGGSRNKLLCQSTASALGIPVLAGPAEATSLGNIIMQAIGIGEIANIKQGREIILRSDPPVEYTPKDTEIWEEAFERYKKICEKRAEADI